MEITKSIETLSNYKEFAHFIKQVHFMREEAIASMFEAEPHTVQQISGQILGCDSVLKMVDSETLFTRHEI